MEVLASLLLVCRLGFEGVYEKTPEEMINYDLRNLKTIKWMKAELELPLINVPLVLPQNIPLPGIVKPKLMFP